MKSIDYRTARLVCLVIFGVFPIACGTSEDQAEASSGGERDVEAAELDIETLQRVFGMEGTLQDDQFKVAVPQNDLHMTVDGVTIIPPMGVGSWAAFAPGLEGAVVMGDVVVREEEVRPVQQVLTENGLTVTALHKHFLREEPRVMYMHIGGAGPEVELASGVRAAFDKVAELRGGNPADAEAQTVPNTLDTLRVAEILGNSGTLNRGVYKVVIPRSDLQVRAHGVPVIGFMGLTTWAAWQGTPEDAAVAGDFAMTADEVAPVVQTLAEHDIEVVSIHNHMVSESPKIFFLHYWGRGAAEDLAHGLRAALNETGVSPAR